MKKVIYCVIGLLALFSILRVRAEDKQPNRLTVNPSLVELNEKDSGLSIGFGLIEADGEKTRVWNVFPLRIALRSGDKRLYLVLNGLSFLTQGGVNFGGEKIIKDAYTGDVISVGGPVTVNSRVTGSVWAFGADIKLESNADITGDVVALGGEIEALKGSRIRGNKQSIPQITIPFLGFLTSPQSAETLQFILELFGVLLFLMALFLVVHFRQESLTILSGLYFDRWKGILLYLFLGILVLPVFIVLLIASVIGIFMVPVVLIMVMALTYFGFLGASVRIGQIFLKGDTDSSARIYLCGLLGFFLIRAPSLIGRLLSLLTSDVLTAVGWFLKVIGTMLLFVFLVYSFGSGLMYFRTGRKQD